MLLSIGFPDASIAGRKRAVCSTRTSCGSKPPSVVFSVIRTSRTRPSSPTFTVAMACPASFFEPMLILEVLAPSMTCGSAGPVCAHTVAGTVINKRYGNTARAVANMDALAPDLTFARAPPARTGRHPRPGGAGKSDLLEAAGRAQRPLRVHESE